MIFDIDITFDKYFENDLKLPWLPWVGKNFINAEKRTMLLGESTYNWNPKDENVSKRIAKNDHLRVLHQYHALNFNRKSKYIRNIERAIFQTKYPTNECKEALWSSVVYHNLVLRPMPSKNNRPTYHDYLLGWEVFVKLVIELKLEQCIVYGLESIKIDSLEEQLKNQNIEYERKKLKENISRSYPKILTLKINSRNVTVIFIRHPSAYFNWQKWGDVLGKTIQLSKTV